jgi:hypothetical protein
LCVYAEEKLTAHNTPTQQNTTNISQHSTTQHLLWSLVLAIEEKFGGKERFVERYGGNHSIPSAQYVPSS